MTIFLLIIWLNATLVIPIIIQPKGPTHRNLALKCIRKITEDTIKFTRAKYFRVISPQFLITYLMTDNLSTPGYEIQEEVLKMVHSQKIWTVEVLESSNRDFQSYSENCQNAEGRQEKCVQKHGMNYKTYFYIMVAENLENFKEKLKYITKASNFNPKAVCLVYFSTIDSNNYSVINETVLELYKLSMTNTLVMVPGNLTTFEMYQMKMGNAGGKRCFSDFNVVMSHQCIKGNITRHHINLFKEHPLTNFKKCFIRVHAISYEPFVISEELGVEIDILRELEVALNVTFEIKLNKNATNRLGYNINGTWTGFIAPIYERWDLGIGNIAADAQYIPDFTFSVGYCSQRVVWVVPIAALIPRWRVLMVIFTLQMWGICLAVLFCFSIFFYLSKTKEEVVTFNTFEKCFAAAFEILVAVPVSIQPRTHFTRVFFIGLAFVAIILNSIYTCSLVYYLQNPIREHQISTYAEVATSGIAVGGPAKYKQMFEASEHHYAKMILKTYQTVDNSLDTYKYWLNLVANKKNISTISIRMCVYYLMSQKKSFLVDRHGDHKVFIIQRPIITQQISVMMRRGAFIESKLNTLIQELIVEAGLLEKIKSKYMRKGQFDEDSSDESDSSVEDDDDDGISALSAHHLEGAFAILALGQGFGIVTLLAEFVVFQIKKHGKKRK